MDDSIFRFRSQPFTAAPSATNYWPNASSEQAIESLEGSVIRNTGPGMLIGPSGIGKSMVCSVLASRLKENFVIATLACNRLCTRRALLQNILFELGLPFRNMEEGELRLTLIDAMSPSDRCPNGMVLLVDEAHTLPRRLIEEIRMLTNLVRQGESRVRVVLIGNQLLEERFASPEHESFNQRIAVRVFLQPMTRDETCGYVTGMLNRALGETREIFDESALRAVFDATDGIPRLVNQVCDHALILAEAAGIKMVTGPLIEEAWSDLQQLPTPWHVEQSRMENGSVRPNDSVVIEFGSLDGSALEMPDQHVEQDDDSEFESTEASADENIERISNALESIEIEDADPDPQSLSSKFEVLDDDALSVLEEVAFPEPPNPFEESFEDEELLVDPFESTLDHSAAAPPTVEPISKTAERETGGTGIEAEELIDSKSESERSEHFDAAESQTSHRESKGSNFSSGLTNDEEYTFAPGYAEPTMDETASSKSADHSEALDRQEAVIANDLNELHSDSSSSGENAAHERSAAIGRDADAEFHSDDDQRDERAFVADVDDHGDNFQGDDYRGEYVDAERLDATSDSASMMLDDTEEKPADIPLNLVSPHFDEIDHTSPHAEHPMIDPADDPVMPEYRAATDEMESIGLNEAEKEFLTTGDLSDHASPAKPSRRDDRDIIVVQPKTVGANMRVVTPPAEPTPTETDKPEKGRAVREEYQDLFSKLRG